MTTSIIENLNSLILKVIIKSINGLLCLFRKIAKINYAKSNHTICVIRNGNLGDILCSLKAFSMIRNYYSKRKIILLTSPGNKPNIGASDILSGKRFFDEIYQYHQEINIKEYISKVIKDNNVKTIIYLTEEKARLSTILKKIIFFMFLGVRNLYGFKISTLNVFKKTQLSNSYQIEAKRNISLLPKIIQKIEVSPPLIFNEDDLDKVRRLLYTNINKKILLISPFAKAKMNIWSTSKYKDIIKFWNSDDRITVFIGSPEAKIIAKEYDDIEGVINLCGKTTISETQALMSLSDVMLSLETGTIHLASGTKIFSIIVSSSSYYPDKWRPDSRHVILRKNLHCSPCLSKTCLIGDNVCINMITSEDVIREIKKMLEGSIV